MKTVVCSVNSAYVHSSLSGAILARELEDTANCELVEYTINQPLNSVVDDLYARGGDIYLFSCYLWNTDFIGRIVADLKKIKKCMVILGGPEVSDNPHTSLVRFPEADYVITGEAETIIERFVTFVKLDQSLSYLPNVFSHKNPFRGAVPRICRFEERRFPYSEKNIDNYRDRIVYYETSRGCPHRCSFCLSGTDRKLRYVPLPTVEKELLFFISHGLPIVKFVDRTFNSDAQRARHIVNFIIENNISTTFHLEIRLDEADPDLVELLRTAPVGFFQLECGLQSTNPQTLVEIASKLDVEKFKKNFQILRKSNNIHMHLDLIAMLPRETIVSFLNAFDFAFHLNPHMLQLGFLKILKGTRMAKDSDRFGMIVSSSAPFEVLATRDISHDDYMLLKKYEFLTKRYINTSGFINTLRYLIEVYDIKPQVFFLQLIRYFEEHNLFHIGLARKDLYRHLFDFMKTHSLDGFDFLAYDYIKNVSLHLPAYFDANAVRLEKEDMYTFIREHKDILETFSTLKGLSPKEIYKRCVVCRFSNIFDGDYVLFVNEEEDTILAQKKHLIIQENLIAR